VLPIERSGLSGELFDFALRSHFDFIIADTDYRSLFAVEFDGPSHGYPTQASRDSKKNLLCERFHFPLLRINAGYLNRHYRELDLLTWFIEVWFCAKGFDQAQQSGNIPQDEPFDPCMFVAIRGLRGHFPLWLSAKPLMAIRSLAKAGKCKDASPGCIIGLDSDGIFRGIEYLRVTEESAIMTSTAMRSQLFPVSEVEAIEQILPFQTHELLLDVLSGDEQGQSLDEVRGAVQGFSKYVRPLYSSSSGGPLDVRS
jgi:hypothetical protein